METKALQGRRVLVTRAGSGQDALAAHLRALGAEPLELPVSRIVPPADWGPADAAIARLEEYEWLVFTSQNGVDGFFGRLAGPVPGDVRIAAVGEATAACLKERGLSPGLVPAEYSGQGVLAALRPLVAPGTRVLLPRGDLASPLLPTGLRQAGAAVDEVVVYCNVPDRSRARELQAMLAARGLDAVTFASSSAVTHLLDILRVDAAGAGTPQVDAPAADPSSLLAGVIVACIGPQTAATARQRGLHVDVVPTVATLPALAEALAAALGAAF